ncbi:DNA mismatch repair protein MutS [Cohnella lubricantis]|uniref:DNA mismatch repair protein MutS n=1 Tax=Cohnella lubricantis TaxID=2163172 RepID=A0A841TDX5_9BACL|nr:DNA mismatch repair protein MutS [Cohnella lubricantis]MBB6679643.1 DNA mismatch repair protein MutS [Cohnella lubricantis]MBP2118583.1 DNA mismatch repair protein MutS [Cohnella lubricantis]
MAGYTPMMQQYLSVKEEAKDALLFFRLGDFYEMFFEDALTASRELEITLTGREAGAEERVPMCGVPYHSAEGYIARLVEKGYKVAICEQVEDPATAKGVVRREIVRIVTPGTVMETKSLGDGANNFILGTAEADGRFGLAACDLTTGELYVTSFAASREAVRNELNVYRPAEAVGDAASLARLSEESAASGRTLLCTVREEADASPQSLAAQFPGELWEQADPVRRLAVARLIAYLGETQKRSLGHLRSVKAYDPQMFMALDAFTRRNLELTETVRDRSRRGSLLWLLDKTRTAMGARLLKRWIDQPLLDEAAIKERLDAVEALHGSWMQREELRTELNEVYDLERLVGRIAYGTANGRDLNALKASLGRIPAIRGVCAQLGSAQLVRLAGALDDCADLAAAIDAAITDEPPVSVREGGLIRTGYNAKLDELHIASKDGKKWIAELERQEREATGIKSLKIGFNKVFGYYLEVTRSNLGALPEGRYERKQTLANAERFVTPELKEKEALILEAEDRMVDLEYELFTELRDRIAGQIPRLQKLAEQVAALDVLQSFAEVSAERRYTRPAIGSGYELTVTDGRHPVVEAVSEGTSFIMNDTSLTDDSSILLITGPNMAGKSTYMRQVAMIAIMAQIGCFVPAKRAELPLIDRIFTRIGAADDLVGGQSTFMVEMKDIQVMTEQATSRSLVIIDELGRGTSTDEGMAIAQAVIEYVHDVIGCKALVSTHFHELAHLEQTLPRLRNGCMAVKENADGVTFLRKLVAGAADSSYGIYCAQLAGLPETIVSRAYGLLEGSAAGETAAAGIGAKRPSASGASAVGETGGSYAGSGPETAEADAGGLVQLAMFAEPEPPKTEKPRKPASPGAERIAEKLRKLDVMRMTPLQALEWLNDARNLLMESGESS